MKVPLTPHPWVSLGFISPYSTVLRCATPVVTQKQHAPATPGARATRNAKRGYGIAMLGRDRSAAHGHSGERSRLLFPPRPRDDEDDKDAASSSPPLSSSQPQRAAANGCLALLAVAGAAVMMTSAWAPPSVGLSMPGGALHSLGAKDVVDLGPKRHRPVCERNENVSSSCLPSFMLVGVQKSATSSFYQLFRQHPEVSVPDQKVGLVGVGCWGAGGKGVRVEEGKRPRRATDERLWKSRAETAGERSPPLLPARRQTAPPGGSLVLPSLFFKNRNLCAEDC